MVIALVGLPGAGKTTVGRAVAERLGWRFIDLDEEIERREGMSVPRIFATKGEPYFRALEIETTSALPHLDGEGGIVLSPGGGWITNPGITALLGPIGRIIYLHVSPETALSRLGTERRGRPLLDRPDPLGEMRRLYSGRDGLYRRADHIVDTEVSDLQSVIDGVARLAAFLAAS